MEVDISEKDSKNVSDEGQTITEGQATIKIRGNVFYNPVQEFNRDLSISVLNVFIQDYVREKATKNTGRKPENTEVQVTIQNDNENKFEAGRKYENGIEILEALSATGLRSIRYAKEIAGVKRIVANDISFKAVENIGNNIKLNKVDELVETNCCDATMLMYTNKKAFDAIDLDPYGCPSIFLDSAVQSVRDGGLLLVTATDMAVLAGNCPETCYVKYGSISLRIKSCHEMALRILLKCVESHANRYGRYIIPLLSVSVDFYIRVFVRIYTGPAKCKLTTSKLAWVYNCVGCGSHTLQPLGMIKKTKLGLATGPSVGPNCTHCTKSHHTGGPIWCAPIHSLDFVKRVLASVPLKLVTHARIQGVLTVISEELPDVPLYYTLDQLSGTLHCQTPSMLKVRSALLNGGHKVSYTHCNRSSIKTNAPMEFIWDLMRVWQVANPVKSEWLDSATVPGKILAKKVENEINFEPRVDANPQSRKLGLVRFQENPARNWGPGTRATANTDREKLEKSCKNQGKRKRCKKDKGERNYKKIESDGTDVLTKAENLL